MDIGEQVGNGSPRALHRANPEYATRFMKAFEALFQNGDTTEVISLAEATIEPFGGFYFCPWRRPVTFS